MTWLVALVRAVGLAAVAVGAWILHPAAGLAIAGVGLIALADLIAIERRRR